MPSPWQSADLATFVLRSALHRVPCHLGAGMPRGKVTLGRYVRSNALQHCAQTEDKDEVNEVSGQPCKCSPEGRANFRGEREAAE